MDSDDRQTVGTNEQLRAIYDDPMEISVRKKMAQLDRHCRDFLALSESGDTDRPAVRARVQRLTQVGVAAPSVTTPPAKFSPAKEIPKWN